MSEEEGRQCWKIDKNISSINYDTFMHTSGGGATDIHTSHDVVMYSTHVDKRWKKVGKSHRYLDLYTYAVESLVR